MLARRVFADGRTRAYAWGRAVAREDLAAAAERLIAMSGQFEQRRLARPSYQLDVLDAYCGEEQLRRRREARLAWRELAAARRRHEELTRDAAAEEARLRELAALVEATEGIEPGAEEALRAERERLRHVTELAEGAAAAAEALAPEDGDGAVALAGRRGARARAARAARARARARGRGAARRRAAAPRVGSELRGFLASLEAEPGRVEHVEEGLERIGDARRRFGAPTTTTCSPGRPQRARSPEPVYSYGVLLGWSWAYQAQDGSFLCRMFVSAFVDSYVAFSDRKRATGQYHSPSCLPTPTRPDASKWFRRPHCVSLPPLH